MTTPIHDLRSYMEVLEAAGQLLHVRQPAHLVHELANVAATAGRQMGKAVLFEHPAGLCVPSLSSNSPHRGHVMPIGCGGG